TRIPRLRKLVWSCAKMRSLTTRAPIWHALTRCATLVLLACRCVWEDAPGVRGPRRKLHAIRSVPWCDVVAETRLTRVFGNSGYNNRTAAIRIRLQRWCQVNKVKLGEHVENDKFTA